jgi:hypothetical protein
MLQHIFLCLFARVGISSGPLLYMLPTIQLPVGTRFYAPVQTSPGAHPASCTMGTRSFPGVKRPGHGIDHPPPSSAEVKERVELYLNSPSGPSWPILGWNLSLPSPTIQQIIVKWNVYTCRNRELICERDEERLRLKACVQTAKLVVVKQQQHITIINTYYQNLKKKI